MSEPRYVKAVGFERFFNAAVGALTSWGISLYGTRILAVRGRKSGEWRTAPVNVLSYEGRRYLVAPRGHTQWVRNLRANDTGEIRLGRKRETFHAIELPDDEKPPLLRAYLDKWRFEVDRFFEGVGANASNEELRRIAPSYPIFRLES